MSVNNQYISDWIQKNLFWIGQAFGWGLFFIFNILVQSYVHGFMWEDWLGTALLVASGVLVTSLFRKPLKQMKNRLSTWKFILFLLFSSVAISVLITLLGLYGISLSSHLFFEEVYIPDQMAIVRNVVNMEMLAMVWIVAYSGGQYFLSLRKSKEDHLLLEGSLKDARMNVLKGQINPHFMFNSMNNIRALMLEDVAKAREMITSLSEMLRYSLNSSKREKVSLAEELDIVRHYIALAEIQLEDRLVFQMKKQIAENNISIPPMMIQMLVENAIKHGIGKAKNGGKLLVEITRENDLLSICVQNDGELSHEKSETGIGIENIRKRLELLYNGKASFALAAENNTVRASIKLPLESL